MYCQLCWMNKIPQTYQEQGKPEQLRIAKAGDGEHSLQRSSVKNRTRQSGRTVCYRKRDNGDTLHAPKFNWLVPYMACLLGLQGAVGCSGPWVVWSGVVVNVVARCSCISGARAPKGRRECKKKTPGKRAAIQPIGRRKLTHPVPCLVYLPRVSGRSSILREAEVVVLPVAGGLHGPPATTF